MEFYTVNTDYVNYLRKHEPRIWVNKENGRLRPYVGVVLTVNGNKYYAALSSPKPKHDKMKERLDFIRLEDEKNQLRAVLNLNNIIPVDDSLITKLNVKSIKDDTYRHLLRIELIDIRRKQSIISKKAHIIYTRTTKHRDDPKNKSLVALSYDFLLLEQKLREYLKQKPSKK